MVQAKLYYRIYCCIYCLQDIHWLSSDAHTLSELALKFVHTLYFFLKMRRTYHYCHYCYWLFVFVYLWSFFYDSFIYCSYLCWLILLLQKFIHWRFIELWSLYWLIYFCVFVLASIQYCFYYNEKFYYRYINICHEVVVILLK